MKIIPKKIKIKNTIWKNYSLLELIAILILFIITLLLFINKIYIYSFILLIISIILFIPTTDGLVYVLLYEFIKYICSNKKYIKNKQKNINNIDKIIFIKNITEDGIIEYDNKTYSKVLKLGQKNFLLQDEEDQEIDIECINQCFKYLSINTSMDIIKLDQPINFDNYIDELNEKINAIQKEQYINNKNIKEEILKERKKQLETINKETKLYISNFYLVLYCNNKDDLIYTLDNINTEIKKCGISTNYLNKKSTAIFLKYNYSRNFDEREINNISNDKIIDWIKPDRVRFFSNKYYINDIEASIMSIYDYPLKVKNGWANKIFNIENTKAVIHIKGIEKNKAIKIIDNCILEMETKEILNDSASITHNAKIHKNTMYKLLNNLQAEDEILLDMNITIVGYNYDNDINYRRKIKNKINSSFKTKIMFCNQYEGFVSTNVNSCFLKNKYNHGINSNSLASFFPFVRNYSMDEKGILLGKTINNYYPFIFDIWKRSELYQNSNAFILGKSGSGKTYFLKNLLINEWSNNTRIIICDPEAEYLNIVRNLNGNIINVSNNKEGILNPFHIYKILTEDGTVADSITTFNTHLKTLESFFKIVLNGVSNDVLEIINSLVIKTYAYKGITEETDCSTYTSLMFPIFSDMEYILDKKIENCNDEFSLSNYKCAKLHLQKFVNGRYSDIWNSPSTLQVDADIINFNFQSLFANKNNVVANAQMLLIFRFIEQEIINARELNKYGNDLKTMIIIDEAHMFIDIKYPIALDFFYQMSKRIRKYNGSFIPTTQNIADWNSNDELRYKTSTIIKNSQYTFLFKLSSPDMQDMLEIYKAGNSFNKEERKIIISLTTGELFFVGGSDLRTTMKVEANNYIKSIFNKEVNYNEKND